MKAKFKGTMLWFSMTAVLAAAAFGAAQNLPDGPGKSLLEGNCASCHGLDLITEKHWGEQSWQDVIAEMREKGSPLVEEDVPVLVEYLVKHFGEATGNSEEDKSASGSTSEAQAKQIFMTVCTSCHGIDLIEGTGRDKDGWNGVVQGMVDMGAQLTQAQIPLVVDYLAKTYPPEKGPNWGQ